MKKKLCKKLIVLLGTAFFTAASSLIAYAAVEEYYAKAGLIFKFFQYLDWPANKDFRKQSDIQICVLGNSPIKQNIPKFTAAAVKMYNKQFSLVESKSWKSVSPQCFVYFISDDMKDRQDEILLALQGKPILTVSDIEGFAGHGGMIEQVLYDASVKFVVNREAMEAVGIRPSADMLELSFKR